MQLFGLQHALKRTRQSVRILQRIHRNDKTVRFAKQIERNIDRFDGITQNERRNAG